MLHNLFYNPFKKPSAKELAREKLEEKQRQLLEHEAAAIYNIKMAEYCRETIDKMQEHTA